MPTERSGAPHARGPRVAVVTPDLEERIRRVLTVARAQAAGGRYPLVLLDANVIAARLLDTDGCDPATTTGVASTLDVGEELVSIASAARLVDRSPQALRKAAGSGRLPAVKVGFSWMIRRTDLELYRHRKA